MQKVIRLRRLGEKSSREVTDQAVEFDELGESVVLTSTNCLFHNCNHVIVANIEAFTIPKRSQ